MGTFSWVKKSAHLFIRSQEISYCFSRYGVAGSLTSLGVELSKRGFAKVRKKKDLATPLDSVLGKNLALTFAELGPTFIKLGQLMAQRPEWVGEPVASELRILFDRVPPNSFRQIEKILKSEWGKKKYADSILKIEKKPLASASLSQTHLARLKDGREVVLKIQKPGIERIVSLDLMLIESGVTVLETLYPKLNLKMAFMDFKEATLRELDYREEAKNIDRFKKNNSGLFSNSSVIFPDYEKSLLTKRVIALEPLRGKKATEIKANSRVAKRAAVIGVSAVLEQIFEHGFFHADPHAGNLFFMEDSGKVGFIDLGLVGQLESEDRKKFSKVMLAIIRRDRKELSKAIYQLGVPGKTTHFDHFEADVEKLISELRNVGLKNLPINKIVDRLFKIAHDNQIFIPNRYALMIRSCLMIDGLAKQLDSQSSLMGLAAPVIAKSLVRSYNPLRIFRLSK